MWLHLSCFTLFVTCAAVQLEAKNKLDKVMMRRAEKGLSDEKRRGQAAAEPANLPPWVAYTESPEDHPRKPGEAIAASSWKKAVKSYHKIEPSLPGVNETIWASSVEPTCGDGSNDCTAHCIAGQPRDFTNVPGLRKALKHRVIDKFSEHYVVFAVFPLSQYTSDRNMDGHGDGDKGVARTLVFEFNHLNELEEAMEDVGVHQALLLREECTHPSCMENPALQCSASEFGVTTNFDKKDNTVHNICDVQFGRFQTCMHMVAAYEKQHNVGFTWVARSRPDVYWTHPIAVSSQQLDNNRAYVREWSIGYGGMDWFFALPRRHADSLARFKEEASCSQLHHPEVKKVCRDMIGCECFFAAFMYEKKIDFEKLPGLNPFIPAKFCGAPCPHDWEVNDESIENKNAKSLLQLREVSSLLQQSADLLQPESWQQSADLLQPEP